MTIGTEKNPRSVVTEVKRGSFNNDELSTISNNAERSCNMRTSSSMGLTTMLLFMTLKTSVCWSGTSGSQSGFREKET